MIQYLDLEIYSHFDLRHSCPGASHEQEHVNTSQLLVYLAAQRLFFVLYLRANMASSILQIPFRHTTSVSISAAIKQYISNKYDQSPEMFVDDLRIIDELRANAINVQEPHFSGIKRLQTYAAQLRWIGGKFPIDVSLPGEGDALPY